MIKILFLIHDLCQGGAEKVLVNLVNNLDRSRFDISIMPLFDVGVNKQFLKADIKYIRCFKHMLPGNSHLLKLLSPKQLYNWLIKDEYDIVVSYLEGPTARIAAGAPDNVKVVSWIHSTISNEKALAQAFRSVDEAKKCYKRANLMAFVSKSVQDAFCKVCDTSNNAVIYNTNETDIIIEKSKESVDNFDFSQHFNWCAVGKLVPLKGYDRMLRIQAKLINEGFDTHFHVLGIGESEKELKELAKDLSIEDSVTFWGYQTNPYKFVSKCDLFVCASHSEGFSTAATEALIVGTPVCTVDVSGMKELLGENNEWGIITDNKETMLYSAVRKFVIDNQYRAKYKELTKTRGNCFSKSTTVKATEDALMQLI